MDGSPFEEVWAIDFEFIAPPGSNPEPLCLAAYELKSGRKAQLWKNGFARGLCPFRTDGRVLFVTFFGSAEWGCFLQLGWPLPRHTVDLYAEFRRVKNGRDGNARLTDAALAYGFSTELAERKDAFRERIMAGPPFTEEEQEAILDYCASDVVLTAELFRRMRLELLAEPERFGQALLRGRYTQAVARMEHNGIPIDMEFLGALRTYWEEIKRRLILKVDSDYGVFSGETFKREKFEELVARLGIAWPRTETGRLRTDEDTFRSATRRSPELEPLRQLLSTLGQMRLFDLPIGPDGRNRCLLSPFGTKTGRNSPSSKKYIFGPSTWMRSLIRPSLGRAVAYLDWSAQEIAIAAKFSGDRQLLRVVQEGDPYLGFARLAGLAPEDATKDTHGSVRELCKMLFLGVGYGMGEITLANHLGRSLAAAHELLRLYQETFPDLSAWITNQCDLAVARGRVSTVFGWTLHVTSSTKPTTLRNFTVQAHGAEILRLACCLATERDIKVCAPVHDAVLIESDVGHIDAIVGEMRACMDEASRVVLDGLVVKVDTKIVRYPDRFHDKRGAAMFADVYGLLEELTVRDVA